VSVPQVVGSGSVEDERVRVVLDPHQYPTVRITHDDVTAQSEGYRRHQVWNLVDLDERRNNESCVLCLFT